MAPSTPTATLRTPRRRASTTPVEILRATEAVLLEVGEERLSIRRVSERCGYSAPTIYHHFGDKKGLIANLLEERFRVVYQLMRDIPRQQDAALHLRKMAGAFIEFSLENPSHYRLLTTPRPESDPDVPSAEAAQGLVKLALKELAREGTLATSDTEAAFQVLWAVVHGLISLHLILPDARVAEDLVDLAFDMVEKGLLRQERGT